MRRFLRCAFAAAVAVFGLGLVAGQPAAADKPILWLRPVPITRTQGAVLPLPPGDSPATYEVAPGTVNPLPAGTTLADAPINWTYGRVTAGARNESLPGKYSYVGTGLTSTAYYLKWQASTVTVVAP